MDLMQLKYFQVVARTEHVTKASYMLNIAQPALSKSISILESELGVKLFDRKGRTIKLNNMGKLFLKRVDSILHLLDTSVSEMRDLNNSEFGQIKLVVLAASNIVTDVLIEFKKLHPNINFKMNQHIPSSRNNGLDNEFDLCITSSCFEPKEYNHIVLLKEEVFLGVSHKHPFSKRDSIYLKDVEDQDFICLEKGENFRSIIDTYCNYANFNPNIAFECDFPSTVYELIKGSQGVGFISGKSWGIYYNNSLKLLKIKDVKCERYIELYWPNNKYLSFQTKLFIDFLKNYFDEKFD